MFSRFFNFKITNFKAFGGGFLRSKGEEPLGGNTQRQLSLGGNQCLALKKRKKEILIEKMGSIYTILLFSYFSSFSMVVFLPSMS